MPRNDDLTVPGIVQHPGGASGKTREPEITIVIGLPHDMSEIGLEPPLAVQVSREQQIAWGLIQA